MMRNGGGVSGGIFKKQLCISVSKGMSAVSEKGLSHASDTQAVKAHTYRPINSVILCVGITIK